MPNEPDRPQPPRDITNLSNVALERALLDAAMRDPDAASLVAAMPPEAFWGGATNRIAAVIAELDRDGQPIDAHIVYDRLAAAGELDAVGGLAGVLEITTVGGMPESATRYRTDLMELHRLRTGLERIEAARQAILGRDLATAVACLGPVVDEAPADGVVGDVADLADDYITLLAAREAGETAGLPTGMRDLDEIIGGLHPGNFVVVGARTGVGKTAVLCQLATNVARDGTRVLVVSLEMPWPELFDRWVGNLGWINTRRLRRGEMRDDGWAKATQGLTQLAQMAIRIAKPTTVTVPAIRAEARQHQAQLVLVDYLQLVHAVGRRNTNRENDVGEVSRSLKGMALTLGIPVVAAAQLNRNLEGRINKRPELADLRDSGQIEQDSDVVIMPYRPAQHDDEEDPGDIELLVRKNRHGETGVATLTFLGPTQHVVDRATRHLRSV